MLAVAHLSVQKGISLLIRLPGGLHRLPLLTAVMVAAEYLEVPQSEMSRLSGAAPPPGSVALVTERMIRRTEIDADRDDRPIRDGEIVTACQQSCPTQAITFGDKNDRASAVAKRKDTPLDYVLLEELNTKPRTSYSALIRNPNPAIKTQET